MGWGVLFKAFPSPPPNIQSSENGNRKSSSTGSSLHALLGWADVRLCKNLMPGSSDLRLEEGGTGDAVGEVVGFIITRPLGVDFYSHKQINN